MSNFIMSIYIYVQLVNRIHITILSQKVGYLCGKGVDFHPWGLNINSHKWHGLWSMMVTWLNICYLHSLPSS
jgi:hypothetical protein